MTSPFSFIKHHVFLAPKSVLPFLAILCLLLFNASTYAAVHRDKGIRAKEDLEVPVPGQSVSITELHSLSVFYRQLDTITTESNREKLASLWQEYELLYLSLAGHRNGNSYSYEAVKKAYSGEEKIMLPLYRTLRQKDNYAYKMSLLGYSAKEISDVITGRIAISTLDTAKKMRSRGHSEKEISNYLDSKYRMHGTRQRNPPKIDKRSPGGSPASTMGPPHWDALAVRFSERYGINPDIIRAIVKVESNWSPRAVSRKGAVGLMQLMPGTALLLRIDPYYPEQNLEGGVRYFSYLLNTFRDLDLALIAYNAGPGYAERYSRGMTFLYGETRQYVRTIKKYIRY